MMSSLLGSTKYIHEQRKRMCLKLSVKRFILIFIVMVKVHGVGPVPPLKNQTLQFIFAFTHSINTDLKLGEFCYVFTCPVAKSRYL